MKFYCPVDDKETNLKPDGTCEQCDSDLTPLLRLKGLPKDYLEEALRLKEAGHINDAIEKLIMAINMNGDRFESIVELAGLYIQKGMFDEALDQYGRALSIQPSNEEIRKARKEAEELKVRLNNKNNEEHRRLDLLKKLVIAAPIAALLIGLSIIPITAQFKQRKPLVSASSNVPIKTAVFQYIVKPGDCLELIAYRFYGNSKMWRKIYEANKENLVDPNNLSVGTMIHVPITFQQEKVSTY